MAELNQRSGSGQPAHPESKDSLMSLNGTARARPLKVPRSPISPQTVSTP